MRCSLSSANSTLLFTSLFALLRFLMHQVTPRIHSVSSAILALCSLIGQAHAQSAPSAEVQKLEEVVVTGNPIKLKAPTAPVQRLTGDGLVLRMESSLGETLAGLPGVSSTQFGPGASRPIIRGLDADRIRILHNSNASGDASALSPDHAVSIDPLVVQAIEVLRGPATLLYGGNALGGVVNVLDNRIPQAKTDALSARLSAGLGSADSSWNSAAVLDGGSGSFAWHADAFARKAKDVNAPIELACEKEGVAVLRKRICNSNSEATGGALGWSVFAGAWRVGASVSGHSTDYGAVSEDEVSIELDDTRVAMQAAFEGKGWVRSFKLDGFANRYKHTEFEGPEVGTVFKARNNEWRGLLEHAPVGPFKGVIGLQMDSGELSAVGEEAFLPVTRTRQLAAFILEQASFGATDISLGARTEKVRVRSLGAAAETLADRFEARSLSFSPKSISAELSHRLSTQWTAVGSVGRSQRAPKDYELFANGPHIATAAYEVGNPDLGPETATSVELGLRFKSSVNAAQIQVFRQRFRNHILMDATGNMRSFEGEILPADTDEEDALPEYAYRASAAVFTGFEAHGNFALASGTRNWDLHWRLDSVRATEAGSGKALPRIAPKRVGLTAVYRFGPWRAQVGVDSFSAARDNTAKGYRLWDVAATYQQRTGNWRMLWFVKVKNLSNELAYSASSILTTSAPGRVPLPGRALSMGVQASF
jgi:iron complex outermembrane recepter protein